MIQEGIKWSETLLCIPQKWQSFHFLGISFDSLLELSRYAAKTFSVSNVLCESVRKPQACLKVRIDCNLPTAMDIKENLRVRVLTIPGFMI